MLITPLALIVALTTQLLGGCGLVVLGTSACPSGTAHTGIGLSIGLSIPPGPPGAARPAAASGPPEASTHARP